MLEVLRLRSAHVTGLRAAQCVLRTASIQQPCRGYAISAATGSKPGITIDGTTYPRDSWTNVPPTILEQYGRKLHVQPNHPISITRSLIESRFPAFKRYNDIPAVVSVDQNFNSLGFAADHPGRSRTDTYYINEDTLLRTHTTAHEVEVFRNNASSGYTLSADVYRRDAVDRSHYPVFHQMEGALTWDRNDFGSSQDLVNKILADVETIPKHDLVVEDPNPTFHLERNPLQSQYHSGEEAEAIATHLKRSLEDMVVTIFTQADKALKAAGLPSLGTDEPLRVRWIEAFFPHTSPSWELEVWWQGDWLEVLGCGVVDQKLLERADVPTRVGWAFGIGIERIAMLLFGIPDIRLFWSRDSRFLNQFDESKDIVRFKPFSKYPATPRDISFWLPSSDKPIVVDTPASTSSKPSPAGGQQTEPSTDGQSAVFHENDLMEVVRGTAGDAVENVELIDKFTHPKTGRTSLAYRITYRSLEKTLTGAEANAMHDEVTKELVSRCGVEVRSK